MAKRSVSGQCVCDEPNRDDPTNMMAVMPLKQSDDNEMALARDIALGNENTA